MSSYLKVVLYFYHFTSIHNSHIHFDTVLKLQDINKIIETNCPLQVKFCICSIAKKKREFIFTSLLSQIEILKI